MFSNIEKLKIITVNKGVSRSREGATYKNHAFIFRLTGCVRYFFDDSFIDLHPGEVAFLPMGEYKALSVLTEGESHYISIRFEAELTESEPSVFSMEEFQEMDELVNNLPDLWKFGGRAEHYKCYAHFYNFLTYMENLRSLNYADKKKFSIILPGAEYLKKHIYDCDLKVETLVKICGISGTYFQKIFQANFGMSPQQYILGKRLSHAKTIIDSGDFNSISEVALSVGYNDPLYFSRAFKKKYGASPSVYAEGKL